MTTSGISSSSYLTIKQKPIGILLAWRTTLLSAWGGSHTVKTRIMGQCLPLLVWNVAILVACFQVNALIHPLIPMLILRSLHWVSVLHLDCARVKAGLHPGKESGLALLLRQLPSVDLFYWDGDRPRQCQCWVLWYEAPPPSAFSKCPIPLMVDCLLHQPLAPFSKWSGVPWSFSQMGQMRLLGQTEHEPMEQHTQQHTLPLKNGGELYRRKKLQEIDQKSKRWRSEAPSRLI